MKQTDRGLVDDILTGEDVAGFRERSLKRGLTAARARARRRRVLRVGGMPVLAAVLTVWFCWILLRDSATSPAPTVANRTVTAPLPAASPSIEPIGDRELLSLFPGKTVALIGPPGQQRLMVFGEQTQLQ